VRARRPKARVPRPAGATPEAPAGRRGCLTTRDGHLVFEDGTRARFWGINLVNEVNLPPVEAAHVLADQLAAAGFNLVRLHHVDNPRNGLARNGDPQLDAAALARFDALVAAHKGVKVYKVDTDALPELAAKYNASVLPTFSFFKVWRGLRAAAHARAKCAPYRREASLRCRRCRATRRARWPKPSRASQSENRAHFADVTLCGAPSTLRLLAHRRQRGAGVSGSSAVTCVQAAMAQNIDSPLKGGLKRVDMDARLNAIHAPLPVRGCGGLQAPRRAVIATLLTGCASLLCAAGGGQGCARGADQREGCEGRGRAAAREVRAPRRSRRRVSLMRNPDARSCQERAAAAHCRGRVRHRA
jgi:hypothetical protein